MTTRRPTIHVGDKVRIINEKFIDRVGYPLCWEMLYDEVEADPRTEQALNALGFVNPLTLHSSAARAKFSAMRYNFIVAVAKMRVQERGYGGKNRSIWYREPTLGYSIGGDAINYGWKGRIVEVYSKRTVKTGTYYPPSGGYDSFSEESWYEPGGLENMKTHVILSTCAGDIEACDVELCGD